MMKNGSIHQIFTTDRFNLLENAINEHAIVSTTDINGNIIYVNDRFCEISGYSRDELIGSNHRLIKSNYHSSDFFRLLWQTISGGETWHGVLQNFKRDGTPYWVQSTIVPLKGEDGLPSGYLSIRTDVSDRYRMINTLQELSVAEPGDNVFFELSNTIANALNVRWAGIGIIENGNEVRTLGFSEDGNNGKNFVYPLEGTPCNDVCDMSRPICIEEDVARKYPLDKMLSDINAVSYRAEPLTNADGTLIGLLWVIDDRPTKENESDRALLRVTARRAALEVQRNMTLIQLSNSQTLLRKVIDTVPHPIRIKNVEGQIRLVNQAQAELFGVKLDTIEGGDLQNLKNGAKKSVAIKESHLGDGVETTGARSLESITSPVGRTYVMETIREPFIDPVTNEKMVLEVGTDITELMETQENLQRVVRGLRALSKVNRLLVAIDDENKLIESICRVTVEEAGYRMAWVGYKQNDESKSVKVVAHAGVSNNYLENLNVTWEDTERGQGPTGTAIRNRKIIVCEDIQKDPKYLPWRKIALENGYNSAVALPLVHLDEVIGAINIYATEAHSFAEEEICLLKEMADDLALGIVHLRICKEKSDLEQQLRQAQKMESLGQLTSGIAHDFNNILTSVLGYTDLALSLQENDQEELKSFLQQVYLAGERARDLVAQMLIFGRTKNYEQEPSEEASIVQVVKETMKMLRSIVPSSVHLNICLPDNEDIKVSVDGTALQQVIMNLVINARDAMDGKGSIDVEILPAQQLITKTCNACRNLFSGEFHELRVSDNGQGIPPDVLGRMFEPFFTTKEIGKGTGMGLSTIHGIIHKCGGHLTVETEQGKGTTFRVFLPGALEVENNYLIEGKKVEQTAKSLAGKHILVVDDEVSILGFLEEWLETLGMQVTGFSNSKEAMDYYTINKDEFDAVITDQTMPEFTGLELSKLIRSLRPELPIILISGYNDKVNERNATECGVKFISKPFQTRTILDALSHSFNDDSLDSYVA